jgi:hypothetical protein
MSRTVSLVQRVQIASPCPAKWDEMVGDDRSRFCSHCKLNVYNLSAMTEAEGERLIIEKEGKLCAHIFRRYDGTILTKDCPVGLRAARQRAIWLAMRAAAALAFIVASAALAISHSRTRDDARADGIQLFGFSASFPWDQPPSQWSQVVATARRWLDSMAIPNFQNAPGIDLGSACSQAPTPAASGSPIGSTSNSS